MVIPILPSTLAHLSRGDEGLHSSGHAIGPDVLEIVRTLRPRILIPIHTDGPAYFVSNLAGVGIDMRVPQLGEEVRLTS